MSLTLRNDSLVTLRWNEIPSSAVNGGLIGYVIIFQDVNGQTVVNRTVPPTQLSVEINTLISRKQYRVTIYGLTTAGAGESYSFNFSTANGGMLDSLCIVVSLYINQFCYSKPFMTYSTLSLL